MPEDPHAALINLADFGRSPRAQFHAASLSQAGYQVTVLAGNLSPPFETVARDPRIKLSSLKSLDADYPTGLAGAIKKSRSWKEDLRQSLDALQPAPQVILVMTPPAVPTFDILRQWAKSHPESRILIDWHNLGHSRMTLRFGSRHPLTQIYRWKELRGFPQGASHLTVSQALARHLEEALKVQKVAVMHDQNPSWRIFPSRDRAAFLRDFEELLIGLREDTLWMVYPHSWSNDEAPEWLLDALPSSDTPIQILITGEGPGKADFAAELRKRSTPNTQVLLPFLPPTGYTHLLANADWGLCLHTSSSGIDLPMKLADMRGADLPALCYHYNDVLQEVFQEPRDGRFFHHPAELKSALLEIIALKNRTTTEPNYSTWEDEWENTVAPILLT